MKIDRIEISGTHGRAMVFRSGWDIVINVTRLRGRPDATVRRGIGREDSWLVSARPTARGDRLCTAERLQTALEGTHGTQGDVADYLRVIETFAD